MTAGLGLLDGLFCMLDLEHLPAALCHCKAEVQPPEHDLTFPVTGQDRRLALMSLHLADRWHQHELKRLVNVRLVSC